MPARKPLKCPACHRPLRRFKAKTVTLDGCDGGCGGIWFDYGELAKVNSLHPHPSDQIADLEHDPNIKVDDYAIRKCPRCKSVTLDKKLYSLGSGVILDRCPECKGTWLDYGELEKIRETLQPLPLKIRVVTQAAKPEHVTINFAVIQRVHQLQQTTRV